MNTVTIQEQALETLYESTAKLQLAERLISDGQAEQGEWLRAEARRQRRISLLLIAQSAELSTVDS